MSCGQNDTRQKELELKERELALKEKELSLKYGDSTHQKSLTNNTTTILENSTKEQQLDLPFIGEKGFETRPGISGSGTPHRYIEIKENGDVYFGFEQENQADGTVTKEKYYAGKYKTYMKCFFKKWGNELTYYKITKEKISEVNKNNKILTGQECCSDYNSNKECPCEDKFNY